MHFNNNNNNLKMNQDHFLSSNNTNLQQYTSFYSNNYITYPISPSMYCNNNINNENEFNYLWNSSYDCLRKGLHISDDNHFNINCVVGGNFPHGHCFTKIEEDEEDKKPNATRIELLESSCGISNGNCYDNAIAGNWNDLENYSVKNASGYLTVNKELTASCCMEENAQFSDDSGEFYCFGFFMYC